MFNRINERIERKFRRLVVVAFIIYFIFTFSTVVYSDENDDSKEYRTRMFENNYLQYKAIAQVVFTNQNEINPYLISSTSFFGCERIMDVSIKKNMDLSSGLCIEDYFQQKGFSERLNISNENQNNLETKGWKKALVVTGEFAGSFLAGHAIMSATYSYSDVNDYIERYSYPVSYLIGEPIGTSLGTLVIGKLFHQNGSTKGAVIGSVIGTAVGLPLGYYISLKDRGDYGTNFVVGCAILLLSPSVGSVLGYNVK